jgi:hypothetical protein
MESFQNLSCFIHLIGLTLPLSTDQASQILMRSPAFPVYYILTLILSCDDELVKILVKAVSLSLTGFN